MPASSYAAPALRRTKSYLHHSLHKAFQQHSCSETHLLLWEYRRTLTWSMSGPTSCERSSSRFRTSSSWTSSKGWWLISSTPVSGKQDREGEVAPPWDGSGACLVEVRRSVHQSSRPLRQDSAEIKPIVSDFRNRFEKSKMGSFLDISSFCDYGHLCFGEPLVFFCLFLLSRWSLL